MVKTLRGRLIVSHILPLLIALPLMGIVLIYVVETRVMLVNLTGSSTRRPCWWPSWRASIPASIKTPPRPGRSRIASALSPRRR